MRIFRCDGCGLVVPFDADQCSACRAPLGYVADQRTVRILRPTADPVVYEVPGQAQPVWRCLNAAWGCNWVIDTDSDTPWCRSCRLTRGRPDTSRPEALAAWATAEAAKRRLVHQLDEFALPIEARSATNPDGLVFDLVHLPGGAGLTGHREGVVTLDLAETDDRHRDELRRQLGERYRTVIGHLRHEVGHHYWSRLVGQTDHLGEFRRVFGDEREDYGTAMSHYYATGTASWDPSRHVTAYAAAHPLEDWAESFAHYLHIVDVTSTAVAHDLVRRDRGGVAVADGIVPVEFGDLLDAWRPVNRALTAMAESLGGEVPYPFEPGGLVADKLAFVHERVAAHAARDRFYAVH